MQLDLIPGVNIIEGACRGACGKTTILHSAIAAVTGLYPIDEMWHSRFIGPKSRIEAELCDNICVYDNGTSQITRPDLDMAKSKREVLAKGEKILIDIYETIKTTPANSLILMDNIFGMMSRMLTEKAIDLIVSSPAQMLMVWYGNIYPRISHRIFKLSVGNGKAVCERV